MGVELAVFAGVGVICTLIANLPVLVQRGNAGAVTLSNGRLLALLGAQSLLFAGYGVLLAYLQREQKIASLGQAMLYGGMFALIPVVIGHRRTRQQLIHSVAIGLSIVACSAAAFLIAPIVRGN